MGRGSLESESRCFLPDPGRYIFGSFIVWHRFQRQLSKQRHAWYARHAIKPEFVGDKSNAELEELPPAERFHSQSGQDQWVARKLLPNKTGGVFVDIGAHDGQSLSNTLYLERELGWSGLAVEPLPQIYTKLAAARKCTTIQGCVAAQSGTATFQAIDGFSEMLSGLLTERDAPHDARIAREMATHGGQLREIDVRCYALGELLEEHGIDHVDYLDIDVEGAELSILETFDFDRFHISVIAVENNYRDHCIPAFLTRKGFEFHSVVGDEFYVNRRLAPQTLAPAA